MPEEIAISAIGDLLATDIGVGVATAGSAAVGGEAAGAFLPGLLEEGFSGGVDALTGASLGAPAEAAGADFLTSGFSGGVDPLTGAQLHTGAGGALTASNVFTGNGDSVFSPTAESVSSSGLGIGQALGLTTGPGASIFGNFSFPSLSTLGAGFNIFSALSGLDSAEKMKKLSQMMMARTTPWQASGGADMAAGQLKALLGDPSSITTMPGYKAGLDAVERKMASQGYLGSGNMMAALAKYGGDFYTNAVNQLGGLAGAQFNPAAGASVALSGVGVSDATRLAALSQIGKTLEASK